MLSLRVLSFVLLAGSSLAILHQQAAAQEDICVSTDESSAGLSMENIVSELQQDGFILATPNGNHYSLGAIASYSSAQILNRLRTLETVQQKKDRALLFYLATAGTLLADHVQAKCFIEAEFISNPEKLAAHLTLLNQFIIKRPQSAPLLNSMKSISAEMNNEQTLDFLSSIGAVYFPVGGMGIGVSSTNARFNKKNATHLPNEVMVELAANLKKSTPADRAIIYQVENMGHDRGMGS